MTVEVLADERFAHCRVTAHEAVTKRSVKGRAAHAPMVDTPESTNSRNRSTYAQNFMFCAFFIPLHRFRAPSANLPTMIKTTGVTVTKHSTV